MIAERIVTAEEQADCPFSIAEEYAVDYLRRANSVTFVLHRDVRECGRAHNEIRVCWADGMPLLPAFRGTVRLRIAGSDTLVLVEGSYRVPGAGLGRLFDQLIGSHIARASVRDLTHRIASSLEAQEREWASAYPPPIARC